MQAEQLVKENQAAPWNKIVVTSADAEIKAWHLIPVPAAKLKTLVKLRRKTGG
jgi:hypothetical protein